MNKIEFGLASPEVIDHFEKQYLDAAKGLSKAIKMILERSVISSGSACFWEVCVLCMHSIICHWMSVLRTCWLFLCCYLLLKCFLKQLIVEVRVGNFSTWLFRGFAFNFGDLVALAGHKNIVFTKKYIKWEWGVAVACYAHFFIHLKMFSESNGDCLHGVTRGFSHGEKT